MRGLGFDAKLLKAAPELSYLGDRSLSTFKSGKYARELIGNEMVSPARPCKSGSMC